MVKETRPFFATSPLGSYSTRQAGNIKGSCRMYITNSQESLVGSIRLSKQGRIRWSRVVIQKKALGRRLTSRALGRVGPIV